MLHFGKWHYSKILGKDKYVSLEKIFAWLGTAIIIEQVALNKSSLLLKIILQNT
jgi:hypothetical protein